MGCDATLHRTLPIQNVSIHAPAWGATGALLGLYWVGLVSIHAPAWGATTMQSVLDLFIGFNPRTRMGCDIKQKPLIKILWFQSTHPHGVRQDKRNHEEFVLRFQSTHPHGVRLYIVVQS